MTSPWFHNAADILAATRRSIEHLGRAVDLRDAVTHWKRSPVRLRDHRMGGNADILFRYLGHVPANPRRDLNTILLRKGYVFARDAPAREGGDLVANRTKESSLKFMRALVASAGLERTRAQAGVTETEDSIQSVAVQSQARNRFFVLRGLRGVGKTFFLNHLISEHEALLDQDRIIWVRLNLPISRGFDTDLEHWIDAQITKILVRYYDRESEFSTHKPEAYRIGLIAALFAWVDSLPPDEQGEAREAVERLRTDFGRRGRDKDMAPELAPHRICGEVRRIALELGLGFIVVFDGYDRLDADMASSARFKTITAALDRLATGTADRNAVFLVVSRTNTFKALVAVNPFLRVREDATYVVMAPGIGEIVEARVTVLADWARGKPDPEPNPARQLLTLVEGFRAYLFTDKAPDGDWSIPEIDSALDRNARAKTQIMQLRFLDFLSEGGDVARYRYRLVEHLTCAGKTYPPVVYEYLLQRTEIRARIAEMTDHDTRFLPLIFRPPVAMDAEGSSVWEGYHTPDSILHQLRLLQLLAFDRRFAQAKLSFGPIAVVDLCHICEAWFGYSPAVTRVILLELEVYEFLEIHRRQLGLEMDDAHGVRLLPKGERFLRQIVFDVAYLNLSAMRVLLEPSAHEAHLVLAAPVPGTEAPASIRPVLERWIRAKVRNSITMLALLLSANARQAEAMATYKPNENLIEQDFMSRGVHRHMFREIETWPTKVFDELQRILDSALETGLLSESQLQNILDSVQRAKGLEPAEPMPGPSANRG